MARTPGRRTPQAESPAWPADAGLEALAEMALPGHLMGQRWYAAKDAGTPAVSLDALVPLDLPEHPAALAVWLVEPPGRAPQRYLVPLALVPRSGVAEDDPSVLAPAHPAEGDQVLVDAFASDAFVRALVRRMLEGRKEGRLAARRTDAAAGIGLDPAADWPVRRGRAEQSNTSIRVGDGAILKVFRRLEEGVHPEMEMGRFLTGEAGFRATPALLGWAELAPEGGGTGASLCVLQAFVENSGDGWSWVLERLAGGGDTIPWLRTLGRRTAEMHRALGGATGDPDFRAEQVSPDDLDNWAEGTRAMARQALDGLAFGGPELSAKARALADRLTTQRGELAARIDALLPAGAQVAKTRHHGDFHLGQVLVAGDDAVIVDFEGEPLRPLAARRAKHSPLRDVAGMLRSFSYAAAAAARRPGAPSEDRLTAWAGEASQAFLEEYLTAAQGCPGCAEDPRDTVRLVRFFMLEKALYEVNYELANRPDWVDIPLAGVLAILDEAGPGTGAGTAAGPVRRVHGMPFGPEIRPDGSVRFRLWAPSHEIVRLQIEGEREPMDMEPAGDGWFELSTRRAGPGTRYRFVLPDGLAVPDPASRYQPQDVHGPSEVVDPAAYAWRDAGWKGRPWEEAVVYELHVGAFTPEGTFRAAIGRLDHLVELGVTAIEIMPVADFPGRRNWGYDGVLLYTPDSSYGRPEDLKALVDAAHARGLMVMLDVVYNHYGPEGNYLHAISPAFFTDKHETPWGAAVNFDDSGSGTVREFVIHNALYWIGEFNLDGLRLDAVHAIIDESGRHLLTELAERVRAAAPGRHVHLVLENEENDPERLGRGPDGAAPHFTAQWNDDVHHGLHVAASGESAGYYADYAGQPEKLARALAEGFAFQGEVMPYRGSERGGPSAHLPPTAFVNFLQNHDQVGNRAFGDRITATVAPEAVRAAAAIYLLAPQVPMIFMGEEWGAAQPFPFFCDFGPELADAVREGRRREFARFPEFQDEEARERIPDPTAEATFASAKLDWNAPGTEPHAGWLDWYRRVLAVRRDHLVPRLAGIRGNAGTHQMVGGQGFVVRWRLGGGGELMLAANLAGEAQEGFPPPSGEVLWTEGPAGGDGAFGPWAVRWSIGLSPGARRRHDASALDRLAGRYGVESSYRDAHGRTVETSAETKRRLLAAMGVAVEDERAAEAELLALDRQDWNRPLPPVLVLRTDEPPRVPLTLPSGTGTVSWRLVTEEGEERSGEAAFAELPPLEERDLDGRTLERRHLDLGAALPPGYHRLEAGRAVMSLIVSPGRCWLPEPLERGERLWGLAVQLYTLRSSRDWGIGDFGDLRRLVQIAAGKGADVIGLNPLHALFPDNPEHASPYSPASRLLLNVLNIDVACLPEFRACREARDMVASADFWGRLEDCRAETMVAYAEVADLKMQVLATLHHACRDSAEPERWRAFEAFRQEQGEVLERTCLFLALREHFAARDPAKADWHAWPEEYRDPSSPAVARFAETHRSHVDFLAWLQWVADDQLRAAAAEAKSAGMAVGLYRDLAVGADRAGAETWANPKAVVDGAHVGAPPDIFNPAGQDWGLPPFNPRRLREEGYRSFVELLRANMRHAGGLRIDHVMALQHLYWIPEGEPASAGAYVAYPMEDLIGILALESHRNRCLVVGEDLGTVPDGFRERMAAANVLSYRVLFFEQDAESGDYLPPDAYPPLAVAMAGSHDLPTLRGWWDGTDVGLKARLGLLPGEGEEDRQKERRDRDRACLADALRREGLLEGDAPAAVPWEAAHRFLARSRAALALVQIDDVTGEADPVNVPGTSTQHPNWRRKLSRTIEEIGAGTRFRTIAAIMAEER